MDAIASPFDNVSQPMADHHKNLMEIQLFGVPLKAN